jgi:hypothetical protein
MTSIQSTKNTIKEFSFDSSALQVKMFVRNNPKDTERDIAQWLKENDVIIHHIAQSQSEKGGSFVFVLTVFYMLSN